MFERRFNVSAIRGFTVALCLGVIAGCGGGGGSTSSGAATGTGSAMVSVSGLHVSGNKLLNGNGQQVALRGVNYPDTVSACLGEGGPAAVSTGPLDSTSVTALQSWGVNVLRLSINETCWLGINGVPLGGSAYINPLVSYINLLTSANIAVIIDLQWNAAGTAIANGLQPMPDADHATAFWTSVANTLGSNNSVIFDLFNEPYPDSGQDTTAAWACLLNGGTCPGVSYTTVGMQALVNAVRATGATNVIMVPGIQATNQLDQWLSYKPTDSYTVVGSQQIMADIHLYPPGHDTCTDESCWNGAPLSVANSVPLIAGEIGEFDCADGFIDPLMAWLDSNAGGNYLAWGWFPADCASSPALITDYVPGDPSGFGAGFKAHLLSLSP
jgi:endoglucanase